MRHIVIAASLLATLALGCDKKDSTTGTTATPQPSMTDKAHDQAASVANKTADTAGNMKDSAKDTTNNAMQSAKDNMQAGKTAMTDAANKASDSFDASKMIDQAMQYAKENKVELADSTLKQVEAHKASLSPELQTRVDQARKMIDGMKDSKSMLPK